MSETVNRSNAFNAIVSFTLHSFSIFLPATASQLDLSISLVEVGGYVMFGKRVSFAETAWEKRDAVYALPFASILLLSLFG